MPLHVYLLPEPVAADVVVIIDVLRFTSSAAYALAAGARSIATCETVEQARAVAGYRPGTLLAGERQAVKPPGFDLGNSPLEFTPAAVRGRDIAWTTTNGTRAIATALAPGRPAAPPPTERAPHRDLLLASPVNLSAVAALLAPRLGEDAVVAVACSGREGGFALEDAACAGHLVARLQRVLGDALTMNDGARASACIHEAYGEDSARLFRDAQHGRWLRDHGFGSDLEACGALDALEVVPRWRDGRFVAG